MKTFINKSATILLKLLVKFSLLFVRKSSIDHFLFTHGYIGMSKLEYLSNNGWFRSHMESQSVDANRSPLPWITYPAIDFLQSRIKSRFVVFEYGSGNSSFWWARYVKAVFSVEHDEKWFERQQSHNLGNLTIDYIPLDKSHRYERAIERTGNLFDIVVVDGRKRVNCMLICGKYLSPEGVVILDNSERRQYARGRRYLAQNGFKCIDFWGMCPIVGISSCTTIFYKDHNCLGI